MILNTTAENQAVLSNVGEIGEFRIRNSAKAFGILSSGLYANKIRAIIRELSCNAVDSHVDAGRADTPFDLHLPNQLEPHFAIRDYGTGLDHDQVTKIYTTYFESTKTGSNDFIGALGLGSKSPFSYTDNFTVTAVKNGRKGIYTAFINDQGVPSIALMMEDATDEPSGVEIKFAVNDHNDFYKFRQEAQIVYTHFKLRPVVNDANWQFANVKYTDRDIVPGIHYTGNRSSVAVMGNISYPIDAPNAEKVLGALRNLLNCGLEIHFDIGELDFQASREGLSYVPQTIEAIRKRLVQLNDRLAAHIQESADKITNLWERAFFLREKKSEALWNAAVNQYVTNTKFPLIGVGYGSDTYSFKLYDDELAQKYNIAIRAFEYATHNGIASTIKHSRDYTSYSTPMAQEKHYLNISTVRSVAFVITDTRMGAFERAKYHWRNAPVKKNTRVYVLEAHDKTKPMLTDKFRADLLDPPQVFKASELLKKPAKQVVRGQNVTILKLERRNSSGRRRADDDMVWREAGGFKDFDAKATHYYVPINGFKFISKVADNAWDIKQLFEDARTCGLGIFDYGVVLYGVRKADLEFVKGKKNWVNFEDYLQQRLNNIDQKMLDTLAASTVAKTSMLVYDPKIVEKVTTGNSPYVRLVNRVKVEKNGSYDIAAIQRLCVVYSPAAGVTPAKHVEKFSAECDQVLNRYPLLKSIERHPYRRLDLDAVVEYINMVDQVKGV